EKNVISYTSEFPVSGNAHIMRSHQDSDLSTHRRNGLDTSHNMNMKLTTLFAAALAVVGFCKTASAVTYPLPTDGSRLVGQNQVVTVPEGNAQPLEYFAAQYQ